MALFMDKLKVAGILVRANVPRPEAEEFAEAVAESLEAAATEDDIRRQVEPVQIRLKSLEERTDAKFAAMMERFEARMDARFAQMDVRFAQMDAGFAQMDARIAQMEVRLYRAVAVATGLILAAISAWAAFG